MEDQNHPIDISSSDSDIDFEVGAIISDDDSGLSTNARAEDDGEHSGSASSSMMWPLNSCQTLHTENHGYPQSYAGFQSSASQRELFSSNFEKLLVKNFEKQAFPPSFHPSVPYVKPNNGSKNTYPFDRPGSMNAKNKEKHTFDNGFMRAKPGSSKNQKQEFPPSFHAYGSFPDPNNSRDGDRVHQSNNSHPFTGSSSMGGTNHENHPFANDFSLVDPTDPFADEKLGKTDERSVFEEIKDLFMRAKPASSKNQKQEFPPSFHPCGSFPDPNKSRDGDRVHQSNNSHPFTGSSSMGGTKHENHPFANGFSSVDPTDPFADEKLGRTDERSVFEEVIQDLNQPKQEAELPDGLLTVPLMRHQKIALAWMMQKEARPICVGGILADDQGLGKTISTIALIQMDRHSKQKSRSETRKIRPLTLEDEDDKNTINLDDVKLTKDFQPFKFNSIQCLSQHSKQTKGCKSEPLILDEDDDKRAINLDIVKVTKDFSPKQCSSQKKKIKLEGCKTEPLNLDDDDDYKRTQCSSEHSKQTKDCKSEPLNLDEDDVVKVTKTFSPKQSLLRHSKKKIKLEGCKTEPLNLDNDDDHKRIIVLDEVNTEKGYTTSMQRPSVGTLVVCPASVLRQWARELRTKVTEDAKLKVLIYHGSQRTKNPQELAKYDVVLTTYAIVANEVPKPPDVDDDSKEKNESKGAKRKRKKSKKGKKDKKGFGSICGTLARVSWIRVVLDEAQIIKNYRTKAAKACCGLRAKKRWCLSGTPLQNVIEELYSYFRFLKYDPYSSFTAFREGIKDPISRNSESGYKKLQVVLRTVMLRRTKGTKIDGKPILNLPPKYINMESLEFTFEERDFYATLEFDSRVQFKAYDEAGTVGENYANILVLLLRLRQACDHPYLCICGSHTVRDTDSIPTLKKLPKDKVVTLWDRLQGSVICQCCEDMPEDAIVSICGHVFCDQCILERLAGDEDTCPVRECKEQLSTKVIFSKVTLRSFMSIGTETSPSYGDPCNQTKSVTSKEYTSSKIRTALGLLKSICRPSVSCIDLEDDNNILAIKHEPTVNIRTEIIVSGPTEQPKKVIVFSQWTRMLDLMETSLRQSGINFRRLDGTMDLFARDKAVREFNTKPEVDVILMSLKAGNLGLNMVSACHVIMLDLWWNPTTEDQAVDRAHRIGQTRAVTVSRLAVKDTVEDRILALQEKKREMVASAYGEENNGGSARLSVQDLRFLFMGA